MVHISKNNRNIKLEIVYLQVDITLVSNILGAE